MIDRTLFLKEVCYVEDVAEAYKQHIKNDGDNIVIYGYPAELARYKWNQWEFQREHRFVLTTLRGPRSIDNPHEYGAIYYDIVRDPIWQRHGEWSPHLTHNIPPEALPHIAVSTGPP